MLELTNATVTLGSRTFAFNLSVGKGERVAVVGASGSGKSTLLNLVGGFLRCSGGDITWEQRSLLTLTPDERPVTTLFQQDNLFEHLSVEDNVVLGLRSDLRPSVRERNSARETLDRVGLAGKAAAPPGNLSGGEQQRVALARCLLRQKPVLLLDEPYGALDEGTRTEMLGLTDEVAGLGDLTVIMVTHQLSDAEAQNARIVRIVDDRIIQ